MGVLSDEAIFPNHWVYVGIDLHFLHGLSIKLITGYFAVKSIAIIIFHLCTSNRIGCLSTREVSNCGASDKTLPNFCFHRSSSEFEQQVCSGL